MGGQWLDGLASFAGWYLSYERPILLVNETNDFEEQIRVLVRLGFDNVAGCLAGGMLGWHLSGHESEGIETMTVQEICRRLDAGENVLVLDVRSDEELIKDGRIRDAIHVHVTRIPERLKEIPRDKKIHIFCGSGLRSMIAASYLQRQGCTDLSVVLGGMAAWRSRRCPIER